MNFNTLLCLVIIGILAPPVGAAFLLIAAAWALWFAFQFRGFRRFTGGLALIAGIFTVALVLSEPPFEPTPHPRQVDQSGQVYELVAGRWHPVDE